MAVSICMADKGKGKESQMGVPQRSPLGVMPAQHRSDVRRCAIAFAQERLAPTLGDSGYTAEIEVAVWRLLRLKVKHDKMRTENGARRVVGFI
jgi:hypothetical protein